LPVPGRRVLPVPGRAVSRGVGAVSLGVRAVPLGAVVRAAVPGTAVRRLAVPATGGGWGGLGPVRPLVAGVVVRGTLRRVRVRAVAAVGRLVRHRRSGGGLVVARCRRTAVALGGAVPAGRAVPGAVRRGPGVGSAGRRRSGGRAVPAAVLRDGRTGRVRTRGRFALPGQDGG